MKALKEKRNSFRSLWRMGLVILSVFALTFAFVACGDSNSADPSGSIPKPPTDGNTNGPGEGQTDPPPTETPKKVVSFNVTGTPTVGYEGQKPPFTGLTVEVWWDNGKYDTFSGNDIAANGFTTVPAVLSAAYTNIVSGNATTLTAAAWTPITVYHRETGVAINQSVTLPGVRAIDTSHTFGSYTKGLSFTGSVGAFYEDDVTPGLGSIQVTAVYLPIQGNGLSVTATGANGPFTLDANYIFTDYWHGFPEYGKDNTGGPVENPYAKRYAYGIDTSEKSDSKAGTVYALISKAPDEHLHKKDNSDSKYVAVPLTTLYNINHVILGDYSLKAKGLENDGYLYWFSDDTRFLGNNASLSTAGVITNGTNNGLNNPINGFTDTTSGRKYWEDVIQNSTVSFDVHYMGVLDTETKTRDADMLTRAFALGNARVESVPNFRLYEDNPDAVTLLLGYYGWDKLQATNVPNDEQWLNYMSFTIPIARFTEAVEFYRPNQTVKDIPIDQRPATGTTISKQLLDSIKATYILRGIYELAGNPEPVYREVPQKYWDQTWFNTGDLRGYSEDVASEIELEVTIRRNNDLLGAGFAAYVGLESTVPIWAIP